MDRVGILIISKCLSAAAIIATLARSERYTPEFYVLERQLNPFNSGKAAAHGVAPDLNLDHVVRFARRYKERIAFGLTDTEDFVIAGGRDRLEKEAGVTMVCVSKEFAVERSKADQRILFDRLFDGEASPRFRIFDRKDHADEDAAVADFKRFAAELGEPVIKPDAPARGAGVGVWGSDFTSEPQMVAFFRNVYSKGRVVVEERVRGEESSFHAFSDGRHFVVAPQTRDYKRALEGDRGRLTGGMGSYRSEEEYLPFLRPSEWERVVTAEERAFRRWKGRGSQPGLRGIVLYDALMHTGRGFRVLERNSRGGNTEQINLLTTMKDDYVDVCLRMVEGTLKKIDFLKEASVSTCVVPRAYGVDSPPQPSAAPDAVDLSGAEALARHYGARAGLFPMDIRVEQGMTLMGGSRALAAVGVAPTIDGAQSISAEIASKVGGNVRCRADLASAADIKRSKTHLQELRGTG